ncbi:hypothetical protein RIT80_11145, partial [Streptococcus pneumoniae]|nr:hypothetical protein [Streptococcus pneumoniae]
QRVIKQAKHPQPLPGATFEQSKPSNLPKLYSKPACLSAALTVSRPLSVIGVIGRRSVSVATRPSSLHAHFTGIGLGSTNSLLCNGIKNDSKTAW